MHQENSEIRKPQLVVNRKWLVAVFILVNSNTLSLKVKFWIVFVKMFNHYYCYCCLFFFSETKKILSLNYKNFQSRPEYETAQTKVQYLSPGIQNSHIKLVKEIFVSDILRSFSPSTSNKDSSYNNTNIDDNHWVGIHLTLEFLTDSIIPDSWYVTGFN